MTDYKLVPVLGDGLLPCPFCGQPPTEYDQIGYSSVKCHGCKFSIKRKSEDGAPHAPDLWNRRAAPTVQGEPVAWLYEKDGSEPSIRTFRQLIPSGSAWKETPLYTAPRSAEQCDTCHGQGEIWNGENQSFGYMSMQPPEPIMEECPECSGESVTRQQPAEQQPANPDDTATAILGDRMYIAGLKAGWNYAEAGDREGFAQSIENGYREIREAKRELAEQQPAPDVAEEWSRAFLQIAVVLEALTSSDSDERLSRINAADVLGEAFGTLGRIRRVVSPDVSALVEALETALFGTPLDDVPNRDNDDIWSLCYQHLPEHASDALRDHLARIETALAAHRNQGGEV